ncbi:Conserved hypothetical protein [Elusimicrobium minutum Pei191]|uniref:Ribosomal RNA small subunit methyltransferase E n=1 Tax=Elusimicrobium minutum (strain Pei191) TaxID=445932 RepID=B2KE99_ELUMP|nr:RsmE family RNA methyltransferase [Elusimicrobium minutum]ACC98845.1 Conserved hypothetical protein [Elusimicrobium minutum Pei191]
MPQYIAEITGERFLITGDEAKHLFCVMRAAEGDNIKIFDGRGKKFNAVIKEVAKDIVVGSVISEIALRPLPYNLTLCFAPVDKSKTEEILDKCTQLGVSSFLPVITERTEHDILKKWENKKERWEQIIIAAVKQCETAFVPRLLAPQKFEQALKIPGKTIIAYEKENSVSLSSAVKGEEKAIKIFIGPAGGFSPREVEEAVLQGAVLVTLGVNIMRAETAAIAAAAIALQ